MAETWRMTTRALARRIRRQSGACAQLGSRLYAYLLDRVASDVEAGGPGWEILRGHDLPPGSSPALRLMGAVHRVVLEGRAPGLARYYPTAGGELVDDPTEVWPPFRTVLGEHKIELRRRMNSPVQTNEVGRTAALFGGFALLARITAAPLRVLELGASAGLNLRFDRFAYDIAGDVAGDADSPVRITMDLEGRRPPVDGSLEVIERRGCDTRPVDPTTADGRLTLLSYVWPDQTDRARLLTAAVEVARRFPAVVDQQSAYDWLEARLAATTPGTCTVVFHSIVMQYLEPSEREAIGQLLAQASASATAEQPLARLAMEPAGDLADVRLTTWPRGDERLLARAGYHGRPVQWLAGDSASDDAN